MENCNNIFLNLYNNISYDNILFKIGNQLRLIFPDQKDYSFEVVAAYLHLDSFRQSHS